MHTGVDQSGHPFIAENVAKHGDYVEIIALIDLLAVPNVCGADTFATSSFELKPLRLAIYQGLPEDLAQFEGRAELAKFRSQLTTADLAGQPIKADRELYKDDSYVPNYVNYPISSRTFRQLEPRTPNHARRAGGDGRIRRYRCGRTSIRVLQLVDRELHEGTEALGSGGLGVVGIARRRPQLRENSNDDPPNHGRRQRRGVRALGLAPPAALGLHKARTAPDRGRTSAASTASAGPAPYSSTATAFDHACSSPCRSMALPSRPSRVWRWARICTRSRRHSAPPTLCNVVSAHRACS